MNEMERNGDLDLFLQLKKSLSSIDPVWFCENYLSLDGKKFRINGNGYKPFADIYRYIGIKALERNSLPVILTKSRQTGGTTMACALEMYFMGSGIFGVGDKPPIRIIHAFPQLELAAAYSKTKLGPMITSSNSSEDVISKSGQAKSYMANLLESDSTNNSLSFKQFAGGNHIWIESVGLDGGRIRGRTADVLFFDECQDITEIALGTASKTLTAAQYGKVGEGVQVFFGTPKRKGSGFHKMWMASSQQYYYLGCLNHKCNKFFPLYTPESDDWEKVWLHGFIVKCPHCGHEQDKRLAAEKGKWFSLRKDDDKKPNLIGFHINKIYMPMFTKEDVIKDKPGIHPLNTERIYRNEVLGEFFQGDSSPITSEEIIEKCGDKLGQFRPRISSDSEEIVVMGVDYGARNDLEQLANPDKVKAAGQSYSTAVILSGKDPHRLNIEFAHKFKKNDPESKRGIIDKLMRTYNVKLCIGDIGFSNDFSTTLHQEYGDRYLVSRATGRVNNHIKFSPDAFPKEISFERDYYIGELIDKFKAGNIRFPLQNFEQIAWLINHCSSMEIKPSISRTGDPTIHYSKGSTPNDGFMALLNAYIAYKFIITKGFLSNNPALQENTFKQKEKVLALLSYLPSIR